MLVSQRSHCHDTTNSGFDHGTWLDEGPEGFKKTCMKEKKRRGGIHQPLYGTWILDFSLNETGCRKVYGGEVSELQTNPMAAKEMIGDGGGRNYTNSQFSDQHRQDAISRVSTVQNSARGPR